MPTQTEAKSPLPSTCTRPMRGSKPATRRERLLSRSQERTGRWPVNLGDEINAKLAKLCAKKSDRDFFIEVGYPLNDVPHLTYGLLKLNREEGAGDHRRMMRDRRFWAKYQSRLTGD